MKALRIAATTAIITVRVLAAIVTLGGSERFLWVGRQVRQHGGFRAGLFGCLYVRLSDGAVTKSGLIVRRRIPVAKVASVDRSLFGKVVVENTGRGSIKFPTWHPIVQARTIETVIDAATATTVAGGQQ